MRKGQRHRRVVGWRVIKGFFTSLIILTLHCPFSVCLTPVVTGKGFHTDVIIKDGVIHTARYNFDEMSVEYAYKALTEDTWHVETVEKFLDEKGYSIGGVNYEGSLKLMVDDEDIYIVYERPEEIRDYAGLLNVCLMSSVCAKKIKLARRTIDGKWYVKEIISESDYKEISNWKMYSSKVYYFKALNGKIFSIAKMIKSSGVGYTSLELIIIDKSMDISSFTLEIDCKFLLEFTPSSTNSIYILCYDSYGTAYRKFKVFKVNLEGEIKSTELNVNIPEDFSFINSFIFKANDKIGCILRYIKKREYEYDEFKYILIIENPEDSWNIMEIPTLEVSSNHKLELAYIKFPYSLWLNFEFSKDKTGASDSHRGKMEAAISRMIEIFDRKLEIIWYSKTDYIGMVVRNYPPPKFDISPPYAAFSFTKVEKEPAKAVKDEQGKKKIVKGDGGFLNFKGTHWIYIFDGKNWRREEVK